MPTSALSICPRPGCPNLSAHGPCPQHARPRRWSTDGVSRHARGYGSTWEAIRRVVLSEEPYCQECGEPATTVDHRIPKAEGGTNDRSNLRSLCAAHQQAKAAREGRRAQVKA